MPMLFAAFYFGAIKKSLHKKISIIIPLICMALFMVHPIGREAWVYSLYWLIPVIAKLFSKNLFFRSLGATFTAHAIGSTIWLYSIPMTSMQWLGLIPIVALERLLFAIGISVSFIAVNTVLHKIEHIIPKEIVSIDKKYILSKKLFKLSA